MQCFEALRVALLGKHSAGMFSALRTVDCAAASVRVPSCVQDTIKHLEWMGRAICRCVQVKLWEKV
jgi:hypothetical protein